MNSVSNSTPRRNLDDFFAFYKKSSTVPEIQFGYVREDMREELMEYFHELEQEARLSDIAASKKETNSNVTLSQDQLDYLVSNYNPRQMSREEYESFLQDMVDMGIITEIDTGLMDKRGVPVPLFTPGTFDLRSVNPNDSPYYTPGSRIPMTYEESGGDILAWFSIQSAFITYDPYSDATYRSNRERSYGRVYSILQQMDRQSPASRQTNYQQTHQTSRLTFDLKSRIASPAAAARL